jgi:aquaporin Z
MSRPAHSGWHWRIWAAEGVGTALMMLGGLSAVCLTFGSGSPVAEALPSDSARRLAVGGLFAACVSLVAVSPFGRLSGAHLNPAVTLSFRVLGRVSGHDVGGYLVAQLAGATLGTLAVWIIWDETALSVNGGATLVETGIAIAVVLEVVMTAVLIGVILWFVSDMRLARWTPLAIWPVITALVWIGSPYTGTSLNPTRSAAPALVFAELADLWLYLAAPTAGAVALASVWRRRNPAVQPKTAKLFHDPAYPCALATDMPATAAVS